MEPPRETAKVANAAVNHGGRVHSLYVAPILQRGPHTNLETVHSRASFSSARNSPEHGKSAALPKDQAKEGAAHRLLNVSGPAGAALGGPGSTRAPGTRETCPRCLRGSLVGPRRCVTCQSLALLAVGGRWLLPTLLRGLSEELKEMRA